eukprot:GFUD01041730.1.p1 GENE.GFUD01041730.1~~GFUD01041730.1.p1  ORF type:complete len:267 (+),score=44.12 GFUD01041730.1:17-817(+)
MMDCAKNFRLTSDDIEINVFEAFKELIADEDFLDVTLVSNGNRHVKAHKLILSTLSPVFKVLLKKNPHPHPLILLKGVSHEDLEDLVKFIYSDEVEVPQDNLQRFLELAEDFQIKGLSNNFSRHKSYRKTMRDQSHPQESLFSATDIAMTSSPKGTQLQSELLHEDKSEEFNDMYMDEKVMSLESLTFGEHGKPEEYSSKQPSAESNGHVYQCSLCDYETKSEEVFNDHNRSKHQTFQNCCEDCSFYATNNLALQLHRFATHSVHI